MIHMHIRHHASGDPVRDLGVVIGRNRWISGRNGLALLPQNPFPPELTYHSRPRTGRADSVGRNLSGRKADLERLELPRMSQDYPELPGTGVIGEDERILQ